MFTSKLTYLLAPNVTCVLLYNFCVSIQKSKHITTIWRISLSSNPSPSLNASVISHKERSFKTFIWRLWTHTITVYSLRWNFWELSSFGSTVSHMAFRELDKNDNFCAPGCLKQLKRERKKILIFWVLNTYLRPTCYDQEAKLCPVPLNILLKKWSRNYDALQLNIVSHFRQTCDRGRTSPQRIPARRQSFCWIRHPIGFEIQRPEYCQFAPINKP